MIAQALVTAMALSVFSVLLGWLLVGGMHDSAHPNGERPHFQILIVGLNYQLGLLPRGPAPAGWSLRIGPSYYHDAWGLDLVWGRIADAEPGLIPWRHWLQFHVGHWTVIWPRFIWSFR